MRPFGINAEALAHNLVDNHSKLIKVCAELDEHNGLDNTYLCGVPLSEVVSLLNDIKPVKSKLSKK